MGLPKDEPLSIELIHDRLYCENGEDCARGVDSNGNCVFGNRAFIDTLRECPDFCTGIHTAHVFGNRSVNLNSSA